MEDPIQRHPTRAEQLDILATLVAEHTEDGDRVMDVGCGTGYVADLVLSRRPALRFVGVDLKAEALQSARANLAAHGSDLELVEGDLMQCRGIATPDGPYRVIWTVLTFHDLTDPAKREVIKWCAEQLAPGGYLFVYDRMRLTEPSLFALQQSIWSRLEKVHGAGMRSADDFASYEADLGTDNRPATLGDYFAWLPEAGLSAQLLHLHGNVMLMAGARD